MKKILARNTVGLLLSIPILGCLSCNKDVNFPADVDIQTTFRIEMNEKLQPGLRSLEFELSSLEILDCSNYAIDYELDQASHKIHLTLSDWVLHEPCEPGAGVATDILDLGGLDIGDYQFLISLKDVVQNEGLLLVRPDHYSIRMETSYGVLIYPTTLLRIPENTIWGGVFPLADTLSVLAEGFLADLEMLVEPDLFPSGNYGPFEIDSDQKVILDNQHELVEGDTFVFRYEGNRDDLVNLIGYYRSVGGSDLLIYLFDEEGYVY